MPGVPELLIILVIALLLFGANKLPGIGDALGRSIKNFKRATHPKDDVEESDNELEGGDPKRALAAGKSQKQLDAAPGASSEDAEWEEVVVRRRKKSSGTK